MPLLSPTSLLLALLGLTLAASITSAVRRRRQRRALNALARQWRMHYSPRDVFDLAPRIASKLPYAGAADVRIGDLIYGTEEHHHRYLFRVHYTIGAVRSRSRRRCVAMLVEPRSHAAPAAAAPSLTLAPEELAVVEQYRWLGQGRPDEGMDRKPPAEGSSRRR